MFCKQCGAEMAEGSAFCTKCGAKAIQEQPQMQNAPMDAPAKKKKKIIFILAGAAVFIILAVFIAMNWEGDTDYELTVRSHTPFISLEYTYGEVFDRYITASEWEVREEDDTHYVDISGKLKGTDYKIKITISVTQDSSDPDIANIRPKSVTIDGEKSPTTDAAVNAIELMFKAYDEGYKDFGTYMDDMDDTDSDPFKAKEDNMFHAKESDPALKENADTAASLYRNTEYIAAYAEKVREVAAYDDTAQFALIDLVGGGIPALVTEQYYMIGIYMWADGELQTLADGWGYGVGGNAGYEYLPNQNVIYNCNSDYAGAILWETYMTVGDDYEIIEVYDESLSIRFINEQGEYIEEPDYYYGDTKISKQEYESYGIPGEYELITGSLSANEILWQLDGSSMLSLSAFSENSLYLFGGSYETGDGTYLDVSIYSSFDEGNIVGNIFLYDEQGHEVFAKIRDDNAGEGIYALCLDGGNVMYIGFYQDSPEAYYADIWGLDGQTETYIMTEQYIP